MRTKIADERVVEAMRRSGLFGQGMYVYTPNRFNPVDWINERFGPELVNPYTPKDFIDLVERRLKEPPQETAYANGSAKFMDSSQWHKLFCKEKVCPTCRPEAYERRQADLAKPTNVVTDDDVRNHIRTIELESGATLSTSSVYADNFMREAAE